MKDNSSAMDEFKCREGLGSKYISYDEWNTSDLSRIKQIEKTGFRRNSYEKMHIETDDAFQTIFYLASKWKKTCCKKR